MLMLFDSVGYNSAGVWRRRLWAMALLHFLPSANSGVISNLDQVPCCCIARASWLLVHIRLCRVSTVKRLMSCSYSGQTAAD